MPSTACEADLDDAYAHMARARLSVARIRRAHDVARRGLGQAVRWRWITENPAVHASPPAVTATEISPPPPELVANAIRAVTAEDPTVGRSSTSLLDRYSHFVPACDGDVAELLDELLG